MPVSSSISFDRLVVKKSLSNCMLRPVASTSPVLVSGDKPVLMRTVIRFVGVDTHKSHHEYRIYVDTGRSQRVIRRRYSSIRSFRKKLHQLVENKHVRCGSGPCKQLGRLEKVKFPSRSWKRKGVSGVQLARARMLPLEKYMQTLLQVYNTTSHRSMRCCIHENCLVMNLVKSFLNILEESEPLESKMEYKEGSGYSYPTTVMDHYSSLYRSSPPPTNISRLATFQPHVLESIEEETNHIDA